MSDRTEEALARRVRAQEAKFTADARKHLAKKGIAMPDGSYPIRNARDLGNAVNDLNRNGADAAAKAHIVKRAKALKLAHKLPDDWNVQEADMHPVDRAKAIDRRIERRMIAEAAAHLIAHPEEWVTYDEGALDEAADSLAKANTPQPFSTSKTSNWVARGGGLPDYIQHVAHGLVRAGHPVSEAIGMAVGIVKRWAAGGGKVDKNTQAAAAEAVAQWEKLKAANAAKGAASKAAHAG